MTAHQSLIPSEFVVQRGRVSDIDAVLAIAKASPTAAQWSRAEYATGCAAPDTSVGVVKALFVACALGSGIVCGFAAFTGVPVAGEYELANMAVAADRQRRGIGRRLMAAGLLWCRSWGPATGPKNAGATDAAHAQSDPSIWLEVRASNRGAIAFYENAAFTIVGIRNNYYQQPLEDAMVMRTPLNGRQISGKLPQ